MMQGWYAWEKQLRQLLMAVKQIKLWEYRAVEYKDCALSDSGLTPDW